MRVELSKSPSSPSQGRATHPLPYVVGVLIVLVVINGVVLGAHGLRIRNLAEQVEHLQRAVALGSTGLLGDSSPRDLTGGADEGVQDEPSASSEEDVSAQVPADEESSVSSAAPDAGRDKKNSSDALDLDGLDARIGIFADRNHLEREAAGELRQLLLDRISELETEGLDDANLVDDELRKEIESLVGEDRAADFFAEFGR